MKRTDTLRKYAFIEGAVVAALIGYFIMPNAVWWVHIIVWLFFSSAFYHASIEHEAKEKIVNSKDH
ncbi:MAG: hypothetical protein GKR93_11905 [Gammaproteobacteria bacterium]|nr:hypothetical protein [Gammaproteobacteria bacterium]